jgi:hypothetical protein
VLYNRNASCVRGALSGSTTANFLELCHKAKFAEFHFNALR